MNNNFDNRNADFYSGKGIEYLEAKRRIKEIRGFYIHLLVYLSVNLLLFAIQFYEYGFLSWGNAFLPVLWGVCVLIHAGTVFLPNLIMGDDWERKKIEKLMNKYKSQNNK
ncbi:2TM domain-containing protein [Elizabethkingia meningoseptica]|uniref:2TM domain-containing protein n=1 Tax=Elizabethkingia meningoseptica TaxID=238 RepID=UPI002011DDD1|nr:2TM domain-containing protein [Elizabethkingia meningoseptica]MCL1675909.1 2TM domain-containing protein [Elizabethkingia meningoseptica]MCL1686445.1 2TM domain-containing protein [Elizabethkingia meningoseptica]